MLLLKTYFKKIVFFGLVIICSINTMFAMTSGDGESSGFITPGATYTVFEGCCCDPEMLGKNLCDIKTPVFTFDLGNGFYDSILACIKTLPRAAMSEDALVATVALKIRNQNIDVNTMYYKGGYKGKEKNIETPLHTAVSYGNLLVMRILLAAGDKRINEPNCHGESVLDMALQKRKYDITTYLVCEAGASVGDTSVDEKSLNAARSHLQIAAAQGLDQVVIKLCQKWGKEKFKTVANMTRVSSNWRAIDYARLNSTHRMNPQFLKGGCLQIIKILEPYMKI